jgi:hypothetical protein
MSHYYTPRRQSLQGIFDSTIEVAGVFGQDVPFFGVRPVELREIMGAIVELKDLAVLEEIGGFHDFWHDLEMDVQDLL